MTSRCYLYSLDALPREDGMNAVGLSEFETEIPLVYKILVSCNPRATKSIIFESEENIAVTADFEGGVRALESFAQNAGGDKTAVLKIIAFLKDTRNARKYIHLECGEIFEMDENFADYDEEMDFLTEMNAGFIEEISHIGSAVDCGLEALDDIPWMNELSCMPEPEEAPDDGGDESRTAVSDDGYAGKNAGADTEDGFGDDVVMAKPELYTKIDTGEKCGGFVLKEGAATALPVEPDEFFSMTVGDGREKPVPQWRLFILDDGGKAVCVLDYRKAIQALRNLSGSGGKMLREEKNGYAVTVPLSRAELEGVVAEVSRIEEGGRPPADRIQCGTKRGDNYLYSLSALPGEDDSNVIPLSRSWSGIPLIFRILVSRNPEATESIVFERDGKVAITADYEKGVEALKQFFRSLRSKEFPEMDESEKDEFMAKANRILSFLEDAHNKQRYIHLECAESLEKDDGGESLEEKTRAFLNDFEYMPFFVGQEMERLSGKPFIDMDALDSSCWNNEHERTLLKGKLPFTDDDDDDCDDDEDFDEEAHDIVVTGTRITGSIEDAYSDFETVRIETSSAEIEMLKNPIKLEQSNCAMDFEFRKKSRLSLDGECALDSVSFYDAVVYCNALSITCNLEPCYSIGGEKNPKKWEIVREIKPEIVFDKDANGWRLPTKEEWLSCAGKLPKSRDTLDDFAVYRKNADLDSLEAAQKYENAFGLVDMYGLVWEWVWSDADESGRRLLLGGSWRSTKEELSGEKWAEPMLGDYDFGFRICRNAGTELPENIYANCEDWDKFGEKGKRMDDQERYWAVHDEFFGTPSDEENADYLEIDARSIIQEPDIIKIGKRKAPCGVFRIVEEKPFAVAICPKEEHGLAFCRIMLLDKNGAEISDVEFNSARNVLVQSSWFNRTVRYTENIGNRTYLIFKKGLSIDEMRNLASRLEKTRDIDDAGYDELSKKGITELLAGKVKNVFQNIQQKTEKSPFSKKFDKKTSQKILDEVKKRSRKPVLRLAARKCSSAKNEAFPVLSRSKFGGYPYWEPGRDFPADENGNNMILLAQLDCEDIGRNYEDFPDFPKTGILQFFISPNDESGFDYDDPLSQKNWRVVYHENRGRFCSVKSLKAMGVKTAEDYRDVDDVYLPFYDTFELDISEDTDSISPSCDDRFERLVRDVVKDSHLPPLEENASLGGVFDKDVYESFWEECNEGGHKIGGYPIFCQGDARDRSEELKDHDVLLLQIDSEGDIMWGDCGVANFFITREDLRNLDFSKVLYTWDCC